MREGAHIALDDHGVLASPIDEYLSISSHFWTISLGTSMRGDGA